MMRAQIRPAYGRGVKYHWGVTDNLRVYFVSIHWVPGQETEPDWLKPRAYFSDRLAAACDGRALMPAHAAQFGEYHDASTAPADRFSARPGALNLPLPETWRAACS